MNNLELKVNSYINNELLNFNNIKTNPLDANDIKDKLVKVKLDNSLCDISNNYSWIYVYERTLSFC